MTALTATWTSSSEASPDPRIPDTCRSRQRDPETHPVACANTQGHTGAPTRTSRCAGQLWGGGAAAGVACVFCQSCRMALHASLALPETVCVLLPISTVPS